MGIMVILKGLFVQSTQKEPSLLCTHLIEVEEDFLVHGVT